MVGPPPPPQRPLHGAERCGRPALHCRPASAALAPSSSSLRLVSRRPARHRLALHAAAAMECAAAAGAGGGKRAALVWLRRDLRLADNAALSAAAGAACPPYDYLLPLFSLDPAELAPRRPGGPPRLGPWRLRFTLGCVSALRDALRAAHASDLLLRLAPPETALPAALAALAADGCASVDLFYATEPLEGGATAEGAALAALGAAAAARGVRCRAHAHWYGGSLLHFDDLPFERFASAAGAAQPGAAPPSAPASPSERPVHPRAAAEQARLAALPRIMTDFRKALAAAGSAPRAALPPPARLPPPPPCLAAGALGPPLGEALPATVGKLHDAAGPAAAAALAALEELTGQSYAGLPLFGGEPHPASAFPLPPGEAAALRRLSHFVAGASAQAPPGADGAPPPSPQPPLRHFAGTRMDAYGTDGSAKLSPYLAAGALSPRTALAAAAAAAAASGDAGDAEGAEMLRMHLEIRDFFVFSAMAAGRALRAPGGPAGRGGVEWRADGAALRAWASGRTGLSFVDACMRELAASGWMSNRGRQNAASLLAKELGHDWRDGADLFESLLLDGDTAINAANWAYVAGVGGDPRADRRFKTIGQGRRYDPGATLAAAWLPELAALPPALRHAPHRVSDEEAAAHGFVPGSYPPPLVDPGAQEPAGPLGAKAQRRRDRRVRP